MNTSESHEHDHDPEHDHNHDPEHDPEHEHKPEQQIFMPDQIVLLAQYTEPDIDENILRDWVTGLAEHAGVEGISAEDARFYTFEGDDDEEGGNLFTMIVVHVDIDVHHEGYTGVLAEKILAFNQHTDAEINGIRLNVASPNWLYGAANHGFGDGGPGGEPVPLTDPVPDWNRKQRGKQAIRELCGKGKKPKLKNVKGEDNGEETSIPVNVVIFDTAPVETYLTFTGNTLLNSLRSRSRLHVRRAADLAIPLPVGDPDGYWLKDKYRMTDHGIFIAGLVHTWAPDAEIYLVEVLNEYGVCTLEGLLRAFTWLIHESDLSIDTPLVINCSLCLCAPLPLDPERIGKDNREKVLFRILNNLMESIGEEKLMSPLEVAMRSGRRAYGYNQVRILAAAGNDGLPDTIPPDARYPAAYDCIVGVGALEKRLIKAWYSNKPDAPPHVGVMAPGGKAKKVGGKNRTESGDGLLGIYLDDFPDGQPSTNGWAWWSGTSFATGVMSGIFAYAAGQGCDISCKPSSNLQEDLVEKIKEKENDGPFIEEEMPLPTP